MAIHLQPHARPAKHVAARSIQRAVDGRRRWQFRHSGGATESTKSERPWTATGRLGAATTRWIRPAKSAAEPADHARYSIPAGPEPAAAVAALPHWI